MPILWQQLNAFRRGDDSLLKFKASLRAGEKRSWKWLWTWRTWLLVLVQDGQQVGWFHKLLLIPKCPKKRKHPGLVHVRGQRSEYGDWLDTTGRQQELDNTENFYCDISQEYKYFVTLLKLIYLYFTWVLFFWQLLTFISYICTQISVLVKTCLLLFMCLKVSKNIYVLLKVIHLLLQLLLLKVMQFELRCCVVQYKSGSFFRGRVF